MSVTLLQFTYPNTHNYEGTIALRIFYSGCAGQQFIDIGSNIVPCGSPQGNFYIDIPVSLVGTTMTVAAQLLPTTDDSNTATVVAHGVWVVNGAVRDWLFNGWIITATLGATVNFASLWLYNQQAVLSPSLSPAYLTAPQVAALIASASGILPKANISPAYGVLALTKAPANPNDPVAVEATDYAAVGHNGIAQPDVPPVLASAPIFVGPNSPLILRPGRTFWTGGVPDGKAFQDGVTNATTTFTSATANFSAADDIGKTIILADSGPGSGALAHALVNAAGVVTSLVLDAGGSGYTTPPTIVIIGGGGQNAAGTAVLTAGIVTSLILDNAGSGYFLTAPSVLFGRKAHSTTIAAVGSPTSITLAAAPPRSQSSVWFTYGTDNTTALQTALNATVGELYVPPGNYLFTGSFTVPGNVTLAGSWDKPPVHSFFLHPAAPSPTDELGTTFLVTNDPGEYLNGTPFIQMLRWNARVAGISFFYPLQPLGFIPNAFPPTILMGSYGDGLLSCMCTAENVEFVNSFCGIYVHNGYPVTIRNVFGDPLAVGIYADKSPDVAHLERIYWGPGFTSKAGVLYTWKQTYGAGFMFARIDEWFISDCFAGGYCQIGFGFIESAAEGSLAGGSPWVQLHECGADPCGWPLMIQAALPESLGHGIYIDGFNAYATSQAAATPQGLLVRSTCTGPVVINRLSVRGVPQSAVVVAGGPFTMTNSYFPDGTAGAPTIVLAGPTVGTLDVLIDNNHIAYAGGTVSFLISNKVRGVLSNNISGEAKATFSSGVSTDVLIRRGNICTDGLVPDTFGAGQPQIHQRNMNQLLVENIDGSASNAELGVYAGSGNATGAPIFSLSTDAKTYRWYLEQSTGRLVFRDGTVGSDRHSINTAGVFNLFKGANVASAAAIVPTGNLFHVTGTTTITSITSTGITAGTRITIIFDGILTFTDGSNLKLAGNFVTSADDTIVLEYDGTNWYEVSRSVN